MRTEEAEAFERRAYREAAGRNSAGARVGAEVGAAATGQTKSEDGLLMERVVERSNMWLAYQRVGENKRRAGSRRTHGGAAQRLAESALAASEASAAGGRVHRAAGAPGRHTEAARRGENARGTDNGGSADPASTASSDATDLRGDVLGIELWVSSGAYCRSATWRSAGMRMTQISTSEAKRQGSG